MTDLAPPPLPASGQQFRETRSSLAALALRLAGATYAEVADALALHDAATARRAIENALANTALAHPDREHLRQEEAARLDRLQRAIWNKAIDPDNPEQLAAQSAVLRIIESRRRLLGLDAPTEISVHTPTQDELERWVATMANAQHASFAQLEANVVDVESSEQSDTP